MTRDQLNDSGDDGNVDDSGVETKLSRECIDNEVCECLIEVAGCRRYPGCGWKVVWSCLTRAVSHRKWAVRQLTFLTKCRMNGEKEKETADYAGGGEGVEG